MLRQTGSGQVLYTLLNGPGAVLGDAEMAPPGEVWAPLDEDVAALASGRGGSEIAHLSGYGVRYVLLARGTSTDLIPILDGEPGLRRLSSSAGEVLWGIDGVTTRARLLSDGVPSDLQVIGGPAEQVAAIGVDATPYLDQTLTVGLADRQLVLGALANSKWNAVSINPLTGEETALEAVTPKGALSWSQAFVVPKDAVQVRVSFNQTARSLWMWLQLVVFIVLVVLALPSRRVEDIDPDVEGAGFPVGAVRHD